MKVSGSAIVAGLCGVLTMMVPVVIGAVMREPLTA